MDTKVVKIDKEQIDDEKLMEAAEILRAGGLVAFPTETVYGLGANALNEEAAKKIYAAKGRPSDNPLIAHISKPEELAPLVKEVPEAGKKLMEAYWPGPLTIIFDKRRLVKTPGYEILITDIDDVIFFEKDAYMYMTITRGQQKYTYMICDLYRKQEDYVEE